jgi:hypothetical protein
MSCDFKGPDYVDLTSSSYLVCRNYFSLISSSDLAGPCYTAVTSSCNLRRMWGGMKRGTYFRELNGILCTIFHQVDSGTYVEL